MEKQFGLQQLAMSELKICSFCNLEKKLFRCSRCKASYYCSKECQSAAWSIHKLHCMTVDEMQIINNMARMAAPKTIKEMVDSHMAQKSLRDTRLELTFPEPFGIAPTGKSTFKHFVDHITKVTDSDSLNDNPSGDFIQDLAIKREFDIPFIAASSSRPSDDIKDALARRTAFLKFDKAIKKSKTRSVE